MYGSIKQHRRLNMRVRVRLKHRFDCGNRMSGEDEE